MDPKEADQSAPSIDLHQKFRIGLDPFRLIFLKRTDVQDQNFESVQIQMADCQKKVIFIS